MYNRPNYREACLACSAQRECLSRINSSESLMSLGGKRHVGIIVKFVIYTYSDGVYTLPIPTLLYDERRRNNANILFIASLTVPSDFLFFPNFDAYIGELCRHL